MFVLILALGLFAMAARPVQDPDVWWHLRAGQEIVHTHSVPRQDSFSYTRLGQRWVAHEWFSEVIFYFVFKNARWTGLIVLFALVIAGTFMLVYAGCAGRPYVAGVVVALGAIATIPAWGVRPQMFTMLLAAVFLALLRKAAESDPRQLRLLWWLPPLLLLWANLHGAFALGLVLIAITLVGWALEAWLGLRDWPGSRMRLRKLSLVLLVCAAVVPLNPNGFELYRYPFQTLRAHTIVDYIVEWASPNFHATDFKPFLGFLLLTFTAVALSRKRLWPTPLLLLLATTYASLTSMRHIPIFALVAIPIVAKQMDEVVSRRFTLLSGPELVPRTSRLLLNAVLIVAMGGFVALRLFQVVGQQSETEAKYFPAAATRFILQHRLPAPLFNYYDWGGYFIAKLYPQYRVFIDGRTDLYGELMDSFSSTARAQGNWRKSLQEYQVRTVVVPPGTALAGVLRLDPGWSKAFEDKQAVIFTRN